MKSVYQERLDQFRGAREKEEVLSLRLGWARAVIFGIGFLFYLAFDLGPPSLSGVFVLGMGSTLTLFLILVVWHRRVRSRRSWFGSMAEINKEGLSRISRDWDELPDSSFPPPDQTHPYALDLDISGRASLFRLLSTVSLPPGLETVRKWLLDPAPVSTIRKRQEAVAELAGDVDFRQSLEAKGRSLESPSLDSLRRFLTWAEGESWSSSRRWLLFLAKVLPLLNLVLITLHFGGVLNRPWWALTLVVGFGLGTHFRNEIHPLMELASGGQERFGRYAAVLELLLETKVSTQALLELQETVRSSPVGAAGELHRLGRRVGWADVRYSPMAHAPLQAFFVWDLHTIEWLDRWKVGAGPHVRGWLNALGELEALSALATLRADNPGWCFPEFPDGDGETIVAREMGHPLLSSPACVRNDLEVGPPGSFLFVTGSNMSGKSTLLRALGLNAVLAQAGGPVCAEEMRMFQVRVQTSMRTADSLAEGVSQYMAELNRIRQVVDDARDGEDGMVLFLLDEPLQGTNEAERRVAVQTILGHLLAAGAIGAVATHDLQLDDTPRLRPAAQAVHLAGLVREGHAGPLLSFDYQLKPGRATSTNALALLRAVGLGDEEGNTTGPTHPTVRDSHV